MKMKKVNSFLAIVLVFLLFSSSASAESLFGLLPASPTPTPAAQSSVAPSYGDFAGVMEDGESLNNAGDTVVSYQNVSARQMEDFGAALQKENYRVVEQDEQDTIVAYKLSNGVFTFTLFYDKANQTLQVVYPKGTEYAQSLFPGYTKVKLGETFKIKDLGEFTFQTSEVLSELKYHYKIFERREIYTMNSTMYNPGIMLSFYYYNISTQAQSFYKYWDANSNSLFSPVLVYSNKDNTYSFQSDNMGGIINEECYSDAHGGVVSSLSKEHLFLYFELPDGALNATDGTLAMTMDFPNGEKYVLMLRENGVNRY